MNSRLSVVGVLVVVLALGAVWFGWRRRSWALLIPGALVLAITAFNALSTYKGR